LTGCYYDEEKSISGVEKKGKYRTRTDWFQKNDRGEEEGEINEKPEAKKSNCMNVKVWEDEGYEIN